MPANKLKKTTRSKESLKSRDSERSKSDHSKSDASHKSNMSKESNDKSHDSGNGNLSTELDAAPIRAGSTVSISSKVHIKIAIVGDWQVGKSSLIVHYTTGKCDRMENLIGKDCSNLKDIVIRDKLVCVRVQDTGYQSTPHVWNDMRDTHQADMILVCYAINNKESFDNVWSKWIPALDVNFPDVPRMLVGCKNDFRESVHDGRKLAKSENAKSIAEKHKMEYKEISILEPDSVDICMERALQLGLRSVFKDKKGSKCTIS